MKKFLVTLIVSAVALASGVSIASAHTGTTQVTCSGVTYSFTGFEKQFNNVKEDVYVNGVRVYHDHFKFSGSSGSNVVSLNLTTSANVRAVATWGGQTTPVDSTVALACSPVVTPKPFPAQINRGAACAATPVARVGDTPGRFLNLTEDQVRQPTYEGVSITPALFLQGVGLTCDVLPGYHFTGTYVADTDGTVDVQAPQLNIYPLYTK